MGSERAVQCNSRPAVHINLMPQLENERISVGLSAL